jgi:hypothetical protein
MNTDVLVLALLGLADIALIVHLRQRHGRSVRMERITASLRMVVRRENGIEALSRRRRLLRAS